MSTKKFKMIPDIIIIEDSLNLKSVSIEDSESFLNILIKNQHHFARFEFQSPTFTKLSDVKLAIESLIEYKKNHFGVSYGLWFQDQLIGLLTINKINWSDQVADIGIWLIEQATNNGFAIRSLQALILMCWNDLHLKTLTAHTAVSNFRCQRLLERLNFKKIQTLKNNIKVRNKDIDEFQYQIDRQQ